MRVEPARVRCGVIAPIVLIVLMQLDHAQAEEAASGIPQFCVDVARLANEGGLEQTLQRRSDVVGGPSEPDDNQLLGWLDLAPGQLTWPR